MRGSSAENEDEEDEFDGDSDWQERVSSRHPSVVEASPTLPLTSILPDASIRGEREYSGGPCLSPNLSTSADDDDNDHEDDDNEKDQEGLQSKRQE